MATKELLAPVPPRLILIHQAAHATRVSNRPVIPARQRVIHARPLLTCPHALAASWIGLWSLSNHRMPQMDDRAG